MIFKLRVIDLEATEAWSKDHCKEKFYVWGNQRGYVITAKSEAEARYVAMRGKDGKGTDMWWTDPSQTSCEQVTEGPFPEIVMADTPTG